MGSTWRSHWLNLVWIFWAAVVLAVYYRQPGRIFEQGLTGLLEDNYSFAIALLGARALASGLPFWPEAALRASSGIWAATMVILAAQVLGAGFFSLRRWQPADRIDRFLFQTALGFGGLAALSFGLAYLGLYTSGSLRIMVSIILLGGLLARVYHRRSRSGRPGLRSVQENQAPSSPLEKRQQVLNLSGRQGAHGRTLFEWLCISISGLAIVMALAGALAPEKEYDALWYHLELPALWLVDGQPVDLVSEYISLYPLTWELLYGLGLALSGPIAAKLLHFTCLVLTGLLVYQWVRTRFLQVSPWLGVVLFVTIPTVLWEATTAYNDLALAYFACLAMYALTRYTDRNEGQWLTLAILTLGLAMATKHLGLFFLVIAVSRLAVHLGRADTDWRRALLTLFRFGFLSLVVPLPWYLRAWAASGNPVFPDLYEVFGAYPSERWSPVTEMGLQHFKDGFGDGRSLDSLLALPWNLTIHASRYGGTLGPMFLLALPALALGLKDNEIRGMAADTAVFLALWASPISSFQLRFLVPITPLLAVMAAVGMQTAGHGLHGPIRGLAGLLLPGLLLLNLPPFISLHEGDRSGDQGWLTHVVHDLPWKVVLGAESQDQYLARSVPSYRAWQYINTYLPEEAVILTFSGGDHFYSQRPRLWSEATIAHFAVWGSPAEETDRALENLHRLGVDYVLHDARLLGSLPPQAPAITGKAVLARWFVLEYEDEGYRLYKLLEAHDNLDP